MADSLGRSNPPADDRHALHVRVEGRVQGVFFRDSTQREAGAMGLAGWVRNLDDGSVEALFVGTRAACERALGFVRIGPPRAAVTRVESRWVPVPEGIGARFEIR